MKKTVWTTILLLLLVGPLVWADVDTRNGVALSTIGDLSGGGAPAAAGGTLVGSDSSVSGNTQNCNPDTVYLHRFTASASGTATSAYALVTTADATRDLKFVVYSYSAGGDETLVGETNYTTVQIGSDQLLDFAAVGWATQPTITSGNDYLLGMISDTGAYFSMVHSDDNGTNYMYDTSGSGDTPPATVDWDGDNSSGSDEWQIYLSN